MDGRVMDYLMDRMDSRRGRDNRDNRDMMDNRDGEDFEDGRRGVKGSGRDRSEEDWARGDRRDGHDVPRLSKSDMNSWKRMLENMDGTYGPHYDMQQIMHAADKANVKFHNFDEKEFCLVVNWLYSDYCRAMKKHLSTDDVLKLCVDMAKDYFDDPDGPDPEVKLALTYHCVVNV